MQIPVACRSISTILLAIASVFSLASTSVVGQEARAVNSVDPSPIAKLTSHAVSSANGETPNTFDPSLYRENIRQLPIGVFDSGLGGLTVLEAIRSLDAFNNDTMQSGPDGKLDFQNERFIYFGDQANMPYGNYNSAGKGDFLRELVLKDAIFLLGKRGRKNLQADVGYDKPPVKAIVIACNTATAVGLEDIRSAISQWKLPVIVIGVVEAGAEALRDQSKGEGAESTVAILATVGTCSTQAYPKTIGRVLGIAGKRIPNVIQQGSVGIAGAIEGDPAFVWEGDPSQRPQAYRGPTYRHSNGAVDIALNDSRYIEKDGIILKGESQKEFSNESQNESQLNSVVNYVRYDVAMLVEGLRQSADRRPISTVVLGCTHFPLVKKEIADSFERMRLLTLQDGSTPFRDLIASDLQFVNPAEDTAKALFRALAKSQMRLKEDELCLLEEDTFYMSVPNPKASGIRLSKDGQDLEYEYKYGRNAGDFVREDTFPVRIDREDLPPSARKLVETRLPSVWKRMKGRGEKKGANLSMEGYEWTFPAMGTTVTLQAYSDSPQSVETIFKSTKEEIDRQTQILTDYDEDSEVSRLSLEAMFGKWQPVSRTVWEVLDRSDYWNKQSNGKLDPSIGQLTRVWRVARKNKTLPTAQVIEAALAQSGWSGVELDRDRRMVRLQRPGIRFDFGAIAKGFIVEQAFQSLQKNGLNRCIVRSGGDMRCGDPPPGRDGWRIAIGKIDPKEDAMETMTLANVAVASSGDLFQFLEVDGKRYSHVIDPATGIGIQGQRMATVIAKNAMDTDACATAMCILGHEEGMKLARSLDGFHVRIVSRELNASGKAGAPSESIQVSKTDRFPATERAPSLAP